MICQFLYTDQDNPSKEFASNAEAGNTARNVTVTYHSLIEGNNPSTPYIWWLGTFLPPLIYLGWIGLPIK